MKILHIEARLELPDDLVNEGHIKAKVAFEIGALAKALGVAVSTKIVTQSGPRAAKAPKPALAVVEAPAAPEAA